MTITLNRASKTLNAGIIDRQIAQASQDFRWQFRLVDTNGSPASTTPETTWTTWQIPAEAVNLEGCNRRASLDGGPMFFHLSVFAAKLPADVVFRQGYRLEVDFVPVGPPPNDWPYFTGVLDLPVRGWRKTRGAAVEMIEIDCFGELQRAEKFHITIIDYSPAVLDRATYHPVEMLGLVTEQRGSITATGPSTSQDLPGASCTYSINSSQTVLSISSTYASTLVNPTAYAMSTTDYPSKITWTGDASVPALNDTVYYKFKRVEYFGVRRYQSGTRPSFFILPYGRDHRDLFNTEVSSYATGPVRITPKDPNPWDSDNGLLDTATQTEYLTIRDDSTGLEETIQITSTDASGVITLNSAPTFTPVTGDQIRLGSNDLFSAWDEYGFRDPTDRQQFRYFNDTSQTCSGAHNASTTTLNVSSSAGRSAGEIILVDSEQMLITAVPGGGVTLTVTRGVNDSVADSHQDLDPIHVEYPRNVFLSRPNFGMAIPTKYHFNTRDNWGICSPVLGPESGTSGDKNRVEEVAGIFMGEAFGGHGFTSMSRMYRDSLITTGKTGWYMKNYFRYQLTLGDVLRELKAESMPPNGFIIDREDGTILIQGFSQAATSSRTLAGVVSVQEISLDVPKTRCTVIARDTQPANQAPIWFEKSSGFDSDVKRVIDGIKGGPNSETSQADRNTRGLLYFTIPGANPTKIFPVIDEVKIYGTGFLTVFIQQSPNGDRYIPGFTNFFLDANGGGATIPGELLARATSGIDESTAWYLIVQMDSNNSTSFAAAEYATLAEVEIWVTKQNAWQARLTDDAAKVPAAYQPADPLTQFGSIWVASDQGTSTGAGTLGTRVSYLWAPTTYLKRQGAMYNYADPDTPGSASATNYRDQHVIIERQGVGQQDLRNEAEAHMAEEIRQAQRFHVTCLFDPRVQRGDTVTVPCPAGKTFTDGTKTKDLFVFGVEHTPSRRANTMVLDCIDYGLA